MLINCLPHLLNEQIPSTNFTYKSVFDKLENFDPNFLSIIKNQTIDKITSEVIGKGYIATIYKICVFVESRKEFVYKVVLKIPSMKNFMEVLLIGNEEARNEENQERNLATLAQTHNTECEFYETFKNIEGFSIPNVYYTEKLIPEKNQSGLIIMDDLSENSITLGPKVSMQVEQIKNITTQLAAFHAFQFSHTKKWSENFKNIGFINDEFLNMFENGTKKLFTLCSGVFDDLLNEMTHIMLNSKRLNFLVNDCCKSLGIPTVVNLGDICNGNILFKADNADQILALIDFQFAFEGNPAFDLSMIMTASCDADIRYELENFIFEYYYEILVKRMQNYGTRPHFTPEQFKQAYEYTMIINAFTIALMLSVHLETPKSDESDEILNENLIKRTKLALEDSRNIVQKYFPEFLDK